MTGAFPMVRSAIGGPDGRGDCRVVGEGAFTGAAAPGRGYGALDSARRCCRRRSVPAAISAGRTRARPLTGT